MRTLGLDIPWPAVRSGQAVRDAPASERFRLFDDVTSLLLAESRIQPLLVLLDDLQWADQPSQLLLDFLARRLPAGAVAVAGSYRDVGPAPGPGLASLAARTTVLPLAGLSPDAVTDLVADAVGTSAPPRSRQACTGAPAATRSSCSRCHGCCGAVRTASRLVCTRPWSSGSPPCPR